LNYSDIFALADARDTRCGKRLEQVTVTADGAVDFDVDGVFGFAQKLGEVFTILKNKEDLFIYILTNSYSLICIQT
jgi:hypothetical protein